MRALVILSSSTTATTQSPPPPYHHHHHHHQRSTRPPSLSRPPPPSLSTVHSLPASLSALRCDSRPQLPALAGLASRLAGDGRLDDFAAVVDHVVASGAEVSLFVAELDVELVGKGLARGLGEGTLWSFVEALRMVEKLGMAPAKVVDGATMDLLGKECVRLMECGDVKSLVQVPFRLRLCVEIHACFSFGSSLSVQYCMIFPVASPSPFLSLPRKSIPRETSRNHLLLLLLLLLLQTAMAISRSFDPETSTYRSPRPPLHFPSEPNLTLASHLFRSYSSSSSSSSPQSLALIDADSGESLTFHQLKIAVSTLSHVLLHKLRLGRGDVVLLFCPNSIHFPVCFLSVVSLGAVATTCNPMYTLPELSKQVNDCRPKLVITVPELYDNW